jgi:hypothetical protein
VSAKGIGISDDTDGKAAVAAHESARIRRVFRGCFNMVRTSTRIGRRRRRRQTTLIFRERGCDAAGVPWVLADREGEPRAPRRVD